MKNLLSKVKMPGSKSKQKNKNSNNAESNSETNSKEDSKDGACSSSKEKDVSKPENPGASKNGDDIASCSNKKDIKFKDLKTITDLSLTDEGNSEEKVLDPVSSVESTKDQTVKESNSVTHPEGTSDSPKKEADPIESNGSIMEDSVRSVPAAQSMEQEGDAILKSSPTTNSDKNQVEVGVSKNESAETSTSNSDLRYTKYLQYILDVGRIFSP